VQSEDKIRVGLIGYGFAGRSYHAPLIRSVAGLDLAVIASSNPQLVAQDGLTAEVVAEPERLIERDDIELVVVATPNDSHAPLARAAILAGKAVVVEKPFALDLAEARALTALAAEHGRMLAVFHNRRWDSDFLTVRQAIEGGAVGRVVHFESHFDRFRPLVRQRWREQATAGAGIWYDLAPHLVDQALLLFGPPTAVSASLAALREGAAVDDWAHAVLHYPDRRVVLNTTMLAAGGVSRFTVHGDKGSLCKPLADRQEAQLLAGLHPGAADWGADPDDLLVWNGDGACRRSPAVRGDQSRFYSATLAALRGKGPSPTAAHEILAVMAVIEAGLISSRTGAVTPLALTPEELAAWT